jgi:hypothetical protein
MIKFNKNGGIVFWSVPVLSIGGSFHAKKAEKSMQQARLCASFVGGCIIGMLLFWR